MSVPFSLVRACVADGPRLVKLLAENFSPHEPLHHAIEAAAKDSPDGDAVNSPDSDDDDDDFEFALEDLPQGHSLLAFDGDDLIGAAVNREITSNEYNLRAELLAGTKSRGLKLFFKFWAYVEKEAQFWEDGGPQKALDLHILVVSAAARGRGVGKALIEESWNVAQEAGYKLFRIDCSSFYSARIADSLEMACIYSLPYDNYKNEKGETAFKLADPHKEFKIFKQKLC